MCVSRLYEEGRTETRAHVAQDRATTHAATAVSFERAMVGAIFLSEGLSKFLLPNVFGVGRFTAIGVPCRSP